MATPRSARRTRATPGRARRSPARAGGADRKLSLSPLERDVLLRACARYRSALPSYLASARDELRILARVLRKLS